MKILIVDRDVVTANLLKSRLVPLGHLVEIHAEKTEGLDKIVSEGWDVIFLDPSPMTMVKPMVVGIRRNNLRTVYMILLSETLSLQDAIAGGLNDFLAKPVDMNAMLNMVDNAQCLTSIQRHLSNDKEDYPSAGGVIAKSAFNQLFLSSLERADRYGELAHIIFISVDNYNLIASEHGQYDADLVVAKLAQHLVRMRRQSDIIAQIRKNEYALLLIRPLTESEPVDAANRFAESLSRCSDLPLNQKMSVEIKVNLMRLPTGAIDIEHRMDIHQS
jgi:diguanylate cyclase (GGDEF)-like protein